MSDDIKFCGKNKDDKGLQIPEGAACSFKSDDQEVRICSLNKDVKVVWDRALHIFGERTFQIDKTGGTNAVRGVKVLLRTGISTGSSEEEQEGEWGGRYLIIYVSPTGPNTLSRGVGDKVNDRIFGDVWTGADHERCQPINLMTLR